MKGKRTIVAAKQSASVPTHLAMVLVNIIAACNLSFSIRYKKVSICSVFRIFAFPFRFRNGWFALIHRITIAFQYFDHAKFFMIFFINATTLGARALYDRDFIDAHISHSLFFLCENRVDIFCYLAFKSANIKQRSALIKLLQC